MGVNVLPAYMAVRGALHWEEGRVKETVVSVGGGGAKTGQATLQVEAKSVVCGAAVAVNGLGNREERECKEVAQDKAAHIRADVASVRPGGDRQGPGPKEATGRLHSDMLHGGLPVARLGACEEVVHEPAVCKLVYDSGEKALKA